MRQARQLREILICTQLAGDSTGNLRDLQRVSQACARSIALPWPHNLGFVSQPAQRCGVQDASAISCKRRPVGFQGLHSGQQ